jgi:ergothioneine biosynthesis protein EgtC
VLSWRNELRYPSAIQEFVMCRFTLYLGPPLRLSSLLLDPAHSLIRQSSNSHEREEPLNGDGFGVGWYAPEFSDDPAVFRSITPAWNNRNLHNLSRVVASTCVLAHVRAATQWSGVNEANCHPFRFGKYLCMHNGDVGNFQKIRRKVLETVCDEAFSNVYGSTDSEHFFAVIIDELLKKQVIGALGLATALDSAIQRVVALVEQFGDNAPSYLNVAVTDGENAVISRYNNDREHAPESLYYYCGDLYEAGGKVQQVYDEVVVSSEKLTEDPAWRPVPPNHLIILSRGQSPVLVPCGELHQKRAA